MTGMTGLFMSHNKLVAIIVCGCRAAQPQDQESKEASALLKTLSLRITRLSVCRPLHAWMCVCLCMCSCFDQQLKIWTCNRLSCGEVSLFLFLFVVFMHSHQGRASTPPPLPPSVSFLSASCLHKTVFKLCISFFPFLMRFRPPLRLRALVLSVFPSLSSPTPSSPVFLSTTNLRDPEGQPSFMGIPLDWRIRAASVICSKVVFFLPMCRHS